MKPFGDKDKDGKLNMFDCKPFDKKRHSKILRDEIRKRLDLDGPHGAVTRKKIHEYMRKFEEEHKEGKRSNPIFKKTYKTIPSEEVVGFFEKNPDLIEIAEKVRWGSLRPEKGLLNREAEYVSSSLDGEYKPRYIQIASAHKNKKMNTGSAIKHELKHLKDDLEGEHEGRHHHEGEYGVIDKEEKKKYKSSEREKRARDFETAKLARDIAKEEGPKPETLQSLKDELKEDL